MKKEQKRGYKPKIPIFKKAFNPKNA
jgi:hypothetical protein